MLNFFFRALISSFEALSVLFYDDPFVHSSMKKINTVLGDLQTFLMVRDSSCTVVSEITMCQEINGKSFIVDIRR